MPLARFALAAFLAASAPLFAGVDVKVVVVDHSLRLSAEEECGLSIDQVGLPEGLYRVTPLPGYDNTINGFATAVIFDGIGKDIRADVEAACEFQVFQAFVPRDLRIEGEGRTVLYAEQAFFGRDLRVQTKVDGGFVYVSDAEVRRDVKLDLRGGAADVAMLDFEVADDVSIRLGQAEEGSASTAVFASGAIFDRLKIECSAGVDLIGTYTPAAPTIHGEFRCKLGGGEDFFDFEGAVIGGKVSIRGGDDADSVSLANCSLDAAVKLDLRDGANQALVATSHVSGDLTIRGGDGADLASVTMTTVVDDLKVSTGDAIDTIELKQSAVGDDAVVKTGKGEDVVTEQDLSVGGDKHVD